MEFFINVKETGRVTAKNIVESCAETCSEPMVLKVPANIDAVTREPISPHWGGGVPSGHVHLSTALSRL
jgi:hypothetical protein